LAAGLAGAQKMPLRRQFVAILEILPVDTATGATRTPHPVAAPPALPAVAAGQLWLIELRADGVISAAIRDAIDDASVVIYDRALSDIVGETLPLGNYAEPAAAQSEAAAARAVGFARDGWSVVRLLSPHLPQRQRTRRVQDVVDEFAAARIAGRLPVSLLAVAPDGTEDFFVARFDDTAAIVDSHPRDTLLTIVIDAFRGSAAPFHAIAANGLAG
jgi:hypothetical protein